MADIRREQFPLGRPDMPLCGPPPDHAAISWCDGVGLSSLSRWELAETVGCLADVGVLANVLTNSSVVAPPDIRVLAVPLVPTAVLASLGGNAYVDQEPGQLASDLCPPAVSAHDATRGLRWRLPDLPRAGCCDRPERPLRTGSFE
jgi:hypothetical protein